MKVIERRGNGKDSLFPRQTNNVITELLLQQDINCPLNIGAVESKYSPFGDPRIYITD